MCCSLSFSLNEFGTVALEHSENKPNVAYWVDVFYRVENFNLVFIMYECELFFHVEKSMPSLWDMRIYIKRKSII